MTVRMGELTYTEEQMANIEDMARLMRDSLKTMKLGRAGKKRSRKAPVQHAVAEQGRYLQEIMAATI